MKVTITIDKQTLHRDIPLSWDQVTFRDFLKLDEFGTDPVKLMALFWHLDYEKLKKAYIKNLDDVVAKLGFLKQPFNLPDYRSIKVLHGYKLPDKLEFEEAGQLLDLQTYQVEFKDLTPMQKLEKYTLYCAIYACKQWYGKYDNKKAEELAPVFLNAPCTEVMAVGNFTLLRLTGLNLSIDLGSLKAGSRIKRFRLALKGWVIRMGSAYHWTILLKKLGLKRMNY